MPDIAVFAKVTVAPDDVLFLKEYKTKNIKALKAGAGFKSLTIWRSESEPNEHLILILFANAEAADAGLALSLAVGPLVSKVKRMTEPPLVRRGRVCRKHGKQASDVPVGAMASISFRVADPGGGEVLSAELERIFEELAGFEGYLGSMICINEALAEEAVGIVYWGDRDAFERSLPSKVYYEVGLFRRTH